MAKFLITGITGFAGPHLANLLHAEGHEVYGLIRRTNGMESDIRDVVNDEVYESITFLYGDLTNYRSLRKVFESTEFNGVFHLAAQSHPPTSFIDPIGTMDTNVMGSANLIQVIQLYILVQVLSTNVKITKSFQYKLYKIILVV